MSGTERDEDRVALRRRTHDLNRSLSDLLDELGGADAGAAACIRRARSALFEAWTMLCTPPEEDDDD